MIEKLNPYAEEIYDLYWNWGLTFAEISETLNVASPASVYRYFAYRFGARTREQQLKDLKEKNTGRIWTDETKENVRKGVQAFYNRNKDNLLNKDGIPKSNCPFKKIMYGGKTRQKETEERFRCLYGDVKEFLQREYVESKKSINTISEETNFSATYINNLLKRYGIPIRGRGDTNKGRKHPMSEQQKQKMKEVASKSEVKKRRSEAQKKYWETVPYKDRLKRTHNGCVAGFNAVNSKTGMSSIEYKIKQQLDKMRIRYVHQKEVWDGDRVYYLDFYLPDYKLVIECNGDYWHSLLNRKHRDKCLKIFAERTNHKIIFIWEHEINDEWFWIGDYINGLT